MPDAPQDVSADERKALIAKILTSRAFLGTEDLPKLLQFLFESTGKLLSAKDIEALHYRRPQATFNPNHARERISKLKDRLAQYEADNPEESVKCELPNADDIGGYQLRFKRLTEPVSACRRFWAAHLESDREVMAVCDPLLFFAEQEKMFRFMDTNIEGLSRKAALKELERLHPEAGQRIAHPRSPLHRCRIGGGVRFHPEFLPIRRGERAPHVRQAGEYALAEGVARRHRATRATMRR